jgi:hypothetical protein
MKISGLEEGDSKRSRGEGEKEAGRKKNGW